MSRIGRFALGVAVSTVGFYSLRSTVWARAERSVEGFRSIATEIPGSTPIAPVKGPAVPIIGDTELTGAISSATRETWNWGVVKTKNALGITVVEGQKLSSQLLDTAHKEFTQGVKKLRDSM